MKIEDSRDVESGEGAALLGLLSFAHLFSFPRINLITVRETLGVRGGRGLSSSRECNMDPATILIAIPRSARDTDLKSDSNSQGVTSVRGSNGGKRGGGMVGLKAHRSFMGHLLGIPVKPTSSRLSSPVSVLPDGAPATPCASLHHSLVRRNGSGSGGYNIFLEDSFSSAVDHGAVAPHGTSAA